MTTRTAIEVLGWAAFALNLWGNELLGRKNTAGWPIRLVANAAWLLYSFGVFAWPLFVNHVVFSVSNARGWWKWTRPQEPQIPASACTCAGCTCNRATGT